MCKDEFCSECAQPLTSRTERKIDNLTAQLKTAVTALEYWKKESEKVSKIFTDDKISIVMAYSYTKRFIKDLKQQIDEALADIKTVQK
jgi:hypothetical protein